jgi:hypothetical protein
LEKTMTAFKSYRVTHEYTQTNAAPAERVFPLLCPVREADWVPGWQYRLIYSDSGVAELGCVFATPNPPPSVSDSQAASETAWIVTEYDPSAFRIGFVWINPGQVVTDLCIQLTPAEKGTTRAHIRYRYTGLSPEGNREVERYDQKWFRAKMEGWESAINHYLRTGRKIDSPEWE